MKKILLILLIIPVVIFSCGTSDRRPGDSPLTTDGNIGDMVLMYYGGVHRKTTWNHDQCMSSVAYEDAHGKLHWMFDGFLFLEFKNGKGRAYASYYEPLPCRKVEWEELAQCYFVDGRACSALEECIDEVKAQIGEPKHKRQVVVTLPEPVPGQKDWGQLNGKDLDFDNDEDRIEACKWYIDEVIRIFKSKNYKNLELSGFYWVAEEATHSRTIVHQVGDYMRSLGYKFYWIPYWGSDGHGEWKELKFDVAYQQPNYFFYQQKPDSVHLPKVCEFAKERGMYLEVEFDERALKSNPDYRADRLHDYMDAFRKCGALDSLPLAYYIGDCMVNDLKVSSYKEDNDLYDWFANIVVKRQQIRGEK